MPERLNVLLIGGGGREHALAAAIARSPRLGTLWTTHPENPGIAALAKPVDVPVSIREIYRLQSFCQKKDIGLVVIGPEEPLAEGYADKLSLPEAGNPHPPLVFGPTKDAAQIEADKAWSKQLMRSASVPTGEARVFTDADNARQYVESRIHDDEQFRTLMERFASFRDPSRRRACVEATLRIGQAALARTGVAGADFNLLRDAGLFKNSPTTSSDPASITQDAAALARLFAAPRADLPVIKASGLAKGKGVTLPRSLAEAYAAIDQMMVKKVFGDAGRTIIVEEKLEGREVSVLALVDGHSILVLPPCQDHKRLKDGDMGPNTGGMGAFCPSPPGTLDAPTMRTIEAEVFVPIVDAMRRDDIEYRGVLYAGIMLTPAGPKVLEFNCRFGDPECQPLLARLKSDVIDLMVATCTGKLDDFVSGPHSSEASPEAEESEGSDGSHESHGTHATHSSVLWDDRAACCIVLAAEGYPEAPKKGAIITGIEAADAVLKGSGQVFHAGTKLDADGNVVVNGGRVLGVTALGATLAEARDLAYKAAKKISFAGMQMRTDIAAGQ